MLVCVSATLARISCGGGPGERAGVGVPVGDVVADLLDEGFDRGEGAAADGLAGDDAEIDRKADVY